MCRIGTLAVKRWGSEANSACERLRLDGPVTIQVLFLGDGQPVASTHTHLCLRMG